MESSLDGCVTTASGSTRLNAEGPLNFHLTQKRLIWFLCLIPSARLLIILSDLCPREKILRLVSQGEDFKTCVPGRRCRKAGELLSFSQPSSSSQFPPSMVANFSKTMLCQTCQIQHCTWPWGRLQQQWPDIPNQRPYLRSLQIGNVFKIHLKWKRWRRSQSGRAAGRKLETKGLLRKICFSPPTTREPPTRSL